MRIEGGGDPLDRFERLRRSKPGHSPSDGGPKGVPGPDVNRSSGVDRVVPVAPLPAYSQDEYIEALRAELVRMVDDAQLRPPPPEPDADLAVVTARRLGHRLYGYVLEQRFTGNSAPPVCVTLDWRRYTTFFMPPQALVLEVRQHEGVLSRALIELPYEMPACVDWQDILQEGAVALLEGYRSFNPVGGVKLGDWLVLCLKNGVRTALRKLHPFSAHRQAQIRRLAGALKTLQERDRREPSDDQLARKLGWKPNVVREVRSGAFAEELLSLDAVPGGAYIRDGRLQPFEAVWERERMAWVLRMLPMLTLRQQTILTARLVHGTPLNEVATRLGIAESVARDSQANAVMILRGLDAAEGVQSPSSV